MTKKHFIALADMIKQAAWADPDLEISGEDVIGLLADFCQAQNPQFNRERWLSYIAGECGKNGGKVKCAA